MSAVTPAQAVASNMPSLSMRWIIGARDDLIWFIGSVLSSYLLFALYITGTIGLVPMVAAWAILVDAPHVFGTFSRTYFDREERRARKRLLSGSLLFFVIGPVMVLIGAGFVFFFVAALWAYYHLVKQHYGFMVLYKKKNNDLALVDNALDRIFLLLAFAYPFVAFVGRDPEAMARVPQLLAGIAGAVASGLFYAVIVSAVIWVFRQVQRAASGHALNVPKYLLLAAAIPMHWVVLLTPMPHQPVAIVTIYHNLQYHRLIWFHNKKYTSAANGRERYGAAELISRRLLYYIGFGVLFGLWYQLPRQYINWSQGRESLFAQTVAAFFWGYAFIHYHLDAHIWRVRRDPSVGRALRMEDSDDAAGGAAIRA